MLDRTDLLGVLWPLAVAVEYSEPNAIRNDPYVCTPASSAACISSSYISRTGAQSVVSCGKSLASADGDAAPRDDGGDSDFFGDDDRSLDAFGVITREDCAIDLRFGLIMSCLAT